MNNNNDSTLLGLHTLFDQLNENEKTLVKECWSAAENAYTPLSHFPVGSAILAENTQGERKVFTGCNVENRFFGPTICAERNAATTAVAQGYRRFLAISLVLKNYHGPGASPCGLCRQVLSEFGTDAVVLQVADKESNVQRYTVADLLPAAGEKAIPYEDLSPELKRAVKRLGKLHSRIYAPYSKVGRSAVFLATNQDGKRNRFDGITDENASFGGTAEAALVAMRSARAAGYARDVTLVIECDDTLAGNPVEGECLQVLREFGLEARALLVDSSQRLVLTTVAQLLPDSFGPQGLL